MTSHSYRIYTLEGLIDSLPKRECVIALGTFDGVHAAHRRLLSDAIQLKKRLGTTYVGAWCFAETPASVLEKESVPLICSFENKIQTMLSLGLDFVAVGEFRDYRAMSAENFAFRILKEDLGCVGVVCGFNHRFGHGGAGTPALLQTVFGADATVIVPEIRLFSETVSSSAVRHYLMDGNVGHAALMLGRPFSLSTSVISGKRLGRRLGFPTANQLFPAGTVIPKHGIYATLCITEDGERYVGVSNVGIRPTIVDGSDSHTANCETYIHGFSGDLYDRMLTVEFHEYLREERKFDSVDDLREQISRDLDAAIDYFNGCDAENLLFDTDI